MYFTWQSLALNPTMRYQLPVYPTLAIFAGWAIIELYDRAKQRQVSPKAQKPELHFLLRHSAWIAGGVVLLLTYAYAFAFTSIYTRPITRIDATRWIYQNIPGPINLSLKTDEGQYNQLLPFPYDLLITPGIPYTTSFVPKVAGELTQITLSHVADQQATHEPRSLTLSIQNVTSGGQPLASLTVTHDFTPEEGKPGEPLVFNLEQPINA